MGFAENFKAARKANGLTQQQLADELGLNRTSISKYESGDAMPNARMFQEICNTLKISMNDLFE